MARFIPNENSYIGFTLGPVGVLAAPTAATATAAGAGNLAAAAYHYKITAVNDEGESLPTADATVTTVSTGGVTLAWTGSAGATGYNIYGRLVGVFHLIATVGGAAVSWVDDGAHAPGTTSPPTISTASNIAAPTVANINDAVDLTRFTTSLNASSQGNNVPTPDFATLFETSILGTSQATFTGDFYRDDRIDTAWLTLPRQTNGFFLIARYGGIPNTVGATVEVWPVRVTSRSMAAMANNTVETFTLTCAVPLEPNEAAVVVA